MIHRVAAYVKRSKSVTYKALLQLGCCFRKQDSSLGFGTEELRSTTAVFSLFPAYFFSARRTQCELPSWICNTSNNRLKLLARKSSQQKRFQRAVVEQRVSSSVQEPTIELQTSHYRCWSVFYCESCVNSICMHTDRVQTAATCFTTDLLLSSVIYLFFFFFF